MDGLVFSALMVAVCLSLPNTSLSEKRAQKPGDIVLGGLFLLHYSRTGDQCDTFFSIGLGHVEAMAFAIDRINKDPKLLPNKTLGYDIRDYCESFERAIRYTYEFVRGVDTCPVHCSCNTSCSNDDDNSTLPGRIVALIGPTDSGSSALVGSLLQVAGIPVISHSATSDEFSSPLYKDFFRTAPPDSQQVKVMADVIEHFRWNYVAVVAVDDSYGRYGVFALERESDRRGRFCIAFSEYIPRLGYVQKLNRIVNKIKQHPLIQVIILWLFGGYAYNFLSEADRQELHDRTWLLSDGLTTEEVTTLSPYSKVLQGSLGFQPLFQQDAEYERHLKSLNPKSVESSRIPWWRDFWKQEYNCYTDGAIDGLKECPANMTLSPSSIRKVSDTFVPYVTDAVYSVAHALHSLYHCTEPHGLLNDGSCRTSKHEVSPSDLNVYLRNVNFDGLTGNVQYDRFGDPVTSSYEIINIRWDLTREAVPSGPAVGSWQNKTLQLNDSMIRWMSNSGVPLSECAQPCQAGTFQFRTTRCCWECKRCPHPRVSVHAGATNCSNCPSFKKPNENSTGCVDLPVANPSWGSTTSVLLTFVAVVGLFLACFTSAVFLKFRNTPIVRASNRELSVVLLSAILMCFLVGIVDLAQPTDSLCRATAAWRLLLFAVIISVLLLKTMRILHAFQFNVVAQKFKSFVYKVQWQTSVVCALISVEIMFLFLWFLLDPPRVQVEDERGQRIFYICIPYLSRTGMSLKVIMYIHIFLLSLLCTYYAFKARSLPENFNEAKYIGFSMYILLISSLVYFPTELGVRAWYLQIMTSAAIIFNSYGLLGCMFGPKLYVILRCAEKNTQEAVKSQVTGYNLGTQRTQVSPTELAVHP